MIGTHAFRRLAALVVLVLAPAAARAYPVDGYEATGIRRLQASGMSKDMTGRFRPLPSGAMRGTADIRLNLLGQGAAWDIHTAPKNPTLQASLESIFANRDPSYSVAVVDITNPNDIQWAGMREDVAYYPGSIGKVLCMTALFDGLRRAFPDVKDRQRILTTTMIVADDWVRGDSHKVPHYDEAARVNRWGPVAIGDRFTLAEWLDHAISASANAAGTVVWREAMLLRAFGSSYPPSREDAEKFFRETPRARLGELAQEIIVEPLRAADLDTALLQQGTFWTDGGQARVPSRPSIGTPRELARWLYRLEQGRIVDEWSSLEMKRYMYITKKRFRYCYAPELDAAAVFFKSGSLYECRKEPGFRCGKFCGNVKNVMNSIAIIESPAEPGPEQRRYIVALMSNVLRKNSAWDHARLAAGIEEAVKTRGSVQVREAGSDAAIQDAGKGD